jgi:type VI secretion system protein ImpM
MKVDSITGLFGKLPAHGDFIHRNLSLDVVTPWDEWLQHFIAGTQEQLGESWLDIYLTSPIWRFVFTSGVIDAQAWAGVLLPSVDRVGRYFPLTVLTRIPAGLNPLVFLAQYNEWFAVMEELTLQALDGELNADDLMQQINSVDMQLDASYTRNPNRTSGDAMVIDMEFEEQSAATAYAYLLDSLLVQDGHSYSAWSTSGSERVMPCVFTSRNLPAIDGSAAMLDGRWQHWQWRQPYSLNLTSE